MNAVGICKCNSVHLFITCKAVVIPATVPVKIVSHKLLQIVVSCSTINISVKMTVRSLATIVTKLKDLEFAINDRIAPRFKLGNSSAVNIRWHSSQMHDRHFPAFTEILCVVGTG